MARQPKELRAGGGSQGERDEAGGDAVWLTSLDANDTTECEAEKKCTTFYPSNGG